MTGTTTINFEIPTSLLEEIEEAAAEDHEKRATMNAKLAQRWSSDADDTEARLAEYDEEDQLAEWLVRAIKHELAGR